MQGYISSNIQKRTIIQHSFGSLNYSNQRRKRNKNNPVSCIEPGLATRFIHDIIHVSMPFSQISPPSPSPTESISLFYTSVSLLLSRVFLYFFALITEEGFLISSCYSLELCIQMLISFLFSSAFCFSSFHSYL